MTKVFCRCWAHARKSCFSLCFAVYATLLLNVITGFISEPHLCYSDSLNLRRQTDAFFQAHTALDSVPYTLSYDLVWDHGIQQVWGLGVPGFRFVFESIAKLFGFKRFPDRFTFLIAYLLTCWFIAATFEFGALMTDWSAGKKKFTDLLCNLTILVLLLLSPPFVTLIRTRFEVYEEVEAYSYLYTLILFGFMFRNVRRPTAAGMVAIAIWGGGAGFVRPTLLAYALIGFILSCCFFFFRGVQRQASSKSEASNSEKPVENRGALNCDSNCFSKANFAAAQSQPCARVLGGALLVFLGLILLLCWSNWLRFGAIGEFGHSLNVTDLNENTFALKFGYPFKGASFGSAVRDELGSLFFVRRLNGRNWYERDLFLGQSQIFRWHELYFSTMGPAYLVLFAASGFYWFLMLTKLVGYGKRFCISSIPPDQTFTFSFTLLAFLWAAPSLILLFVFYLWSPSLSSRYDLDFLPSFTISIASLIHSVARWENSKNRHHWPTVVFVSILLWMGYDVLSAKIHGTYTKRPSLDAASVDLKLPKPFNRGKILAPRVYKTGPVNLIPMIPYNAAGWDLMTGRVQSVVTLFTENPTCVILTVSDLLNKPIQIEALEPIQAKIGLERLTRERIEVHGPTATIVFKGPQRIRYQGGMQVCFLGFITPKDLGSRLPSFRLNRVAFCMPSQNGAK